MPPTRVRPPLHRALADDAGFTVLEALVSFVLLAVVSAAAITAVVNATSTSKNSSDRVNASNLAQQDLQAARSVRYPNYPASITQPPVNVGNTKYTVTRKVSSPCPATPNYTTNPFMLVTTTVTWPPAKANDKVVMATELAC